MSQESIIERVSLPTTTPCEPKPISHLSVSEKKQLIFESLKAQGLNPYQISQVTGWHSKTAYRREKQTSRGLLAPLVNPAKKAIKAALKGHSVGDAEPPKMSDVLNAAKMVMDREVPAVQRVESRHLSARVEVTAEDRQRYLASIGATKVLNQIPELQVVEQKQDDTI